MIAHWLPCKIDANGIKVNSDHKLLGILSAESDRLNDHVLASNFRGRPLRGVELSFPDIYSPVIVHHSGIISDDGPEPVTFGAKLDRVLLWNLSLSPSYSDPIPLSLTWIHLAEVLHSNS
ncbi:ribonuclease H2 subunit C [Schistosoma japonicum]|uniref:Ribonuclease H2 subunit C n=1 Tax=Schistosoma japonicum TaxID=6182 RepID=A0A4Z2D112_SCHJA|nr:ribonuclease H2 subunit C [Schistosoma japonicum]TNN10152.1 ribonuclease H2 subunit C [Schistosoma japonicum]